MATTAGSTVSRPKRKHPVLKTAAFLIVVIAVIAGIAGNNKSTPSNGASHSSTSASKTGSGAAPVQPFRATNAQMAAAVTDVINAADGSPGVAGPVSADCSQVGAGASMSGVAGISCTVQYTVKTPLGASAALELIDPMRGFFKVAFTDPRVQAVLARVSGPVTSVGGKSGVGGMFTLSCGRDAANQIDWNNVGVNGLKALCTFLPEVGGLNN